MFIIKIMIVTTPSAQQTKTWRTTQLWYDNGKRNECECFQWQCIEQILGFKLEQNKNMRLNMITKKLQYKKSPLTNIDGFEWTEDFDGYYSFEGRNFYLNLKFVCDTGGSQTRTLREVYHFINVQLEHLLRYNDGKKYFINILDGDCSDKFMPNFNYLYQKPDFSKVRDKVFIGDTHQFQTFWKELFNKKIHATEMGSTTKKHLGQFYTTNYKYILQNLSIPPEIDYIIEPFTGAGDLLKFIPNMYQYKIECYDIDPKTPDTIQRDIFSCPPLFENKFVITNPPYLARNKCADKQYFEKYKVDDLYKCFIKELIANKASGGIMIIPVNFWCSIRKNDLLLRKKFLTIYKIVHLNIFEEPVFNDTDYSVCAFQFSLRRDTTDEEEIPISIFPTNCNFNVLLNETSNYIIGGEIFNLPRNNFYTITRLTRQNRDKQNTNILLKCIDDDKPIGLSLVGDEDIYIDDTPNLSARSYATLVIEPPLDKEQQRVLVDKFNNYLKTCREKYHSLFLSNYREYKRKRISFELAYNIVGNLLEF